MKKKLYEKRVEILWGIMLLIAVFSLLLTTLKDSYAYYNNSNELKILSTKVGEFAKKSLTELCQDYNNLGECLTTSKEVLDKIANLEKESTMLEREDTLRRYQGLVENDNNGTITNDVNNYICFGSSDKEECTKDTDKYLYRIIGVDTTNKEIKLIKREALNTVQTWTSGSETWAESSLQKGLNSTLYLNNLDSSWAALIKAHDWGYGDVPANVNSGFDVSTTSTQAYQNEQTAIKSGSNNGTLNNTKIGLIYASDYYLSGGDSLMCYYGSSSFSDCKKSWMHLSNNDTSNLSTTQQDPPNTWEWTMSRIHSRSALYVYSDGSLGYSIFSNTYSVRPVFYLSLEIKIIDGDGSRESPYIIEIPPKTAEELILTSNQLEPAGNVTSRGDTLRRYQGQVQNNEDGTIENDVNNYICFETSDKEECKSNTDKYMYRIIGVDTTNKEIKIMKREALNKSQAWGSGSQTWATSSLQTSLNGTLYLNNLSKSWEVLIQPHDWGYGDVPEDNSGVGSWDASNNIEGQQMYKNEKAKWGSNKIAGTKIGLIYVSDYYLSAANIKCYNSSTYGDCKKSWMHLSNNDTSSLSTTKKDPPSLAEWTMSRYYSSFARYVLGSGYVNDYGVRGTYSVRPVFYLKSGLNISGTGTLSNPFVIEGIGEN